MKQDVGGIPLSDSEEVRRYYWYNFLTRLVDIKGGFFTMTYFYFNGFSVEAIVSAILVFGLMSLLALRPVGWIMEKLGPQTTFRLHTIAKAFSFLCAIQVLASPSWTFILLWQAAHAWNILFKRVPLTAYFSEYGDNRRRGTQIGLSNALQSIAGIILPILAGALIDQAGIALILSIDFAVQVACAFILKFDARVSLKNFGSIRSIMATLPRPLAKAYFFSTLPYPWIADLFSVFAALILGSYTALGVFIALRVVAEIAANLVVGKMNDARFAKPMLVAGVIGSSGIWLILPSVDTGAAMFVIQFCLGILALLIEIPFESVFHNLAKSSGAPLQYSFARELHLQMGLVIGCVAMLVILRFTDSWQAFFPVGMISVLGVLALLPLMPRLKSRLRPA